MVCKVMVSGYYRNALWGKGAGFSQFSIVELKFQFTKHACVCPGVLYPVTLTNVSFDTDERECEISYGSMKMWICILDLHVSIRYMFDGWCTNLLWVTEVLMC